MFVEYCNNGKVEEAYNMLTDECKDEIYREQRIFEETYYNEIFLNTQRNVVVENWISNIYKVNYNEDFLSSGKYSTENTKQDYITIEQQEDDTYKLEQIEELVEEESNRTLVITSLKDDETKLRELNKLLDKDNQTIVKMSCQDTKVLRKNFLKRKRRYRQIGLDKEITIGIEIETEGERAEILRKLKYFLKQRKRYNIAAI